MTETVRPLWAGRTLALLGILMVALSLRTAVAAFSPLIDQVGKDIPLSATVLGVMGALPPLVFAASGLIAPLLARRFGLEISLLVAIALMVLGHLGRGLTPGAPLLVASTVVVLVGIGIGNVLLPPVVKRYFPDRVGLVTAMYATLLSISTAVPALVAVPVADAAGWRVALGGWAIVAVIAAVPWAALLVGSARHPDPAHPMTGPLELAVEGPRIGRRVLGSRTAWGITLIFSVSGLSVYACFAWMPAMLRDLTGVDEGTSGSLLALYAIMGFPASLIVPVLAARLRSVTPIVLVSIGFYLIGYLGLIFAPGTATWLWVSFAGLGPLLFPLALVLINLRTRTASSATTVSGFVQGIGYVIAASGPLVVGFLHEATGGWTAPLIFLLAIVALAIPAAVIFARPRFVDDEVAARS